MKILLDHCIDWRLKRLLPSHEVKTAQELGWDKLKNGKLLAAAGANSFLSMLTVDQNLKSEQNLLHLPISVVVLIAKSNRIRDLQPLIPFVELELPSLKIGELMEIDAAGNVRIVAPGRE